MGNLNKILGSNIRKLRKRLGLTQEQLASKVKRHPTYISGIERGTRNITIKVLDDLAVALEVLPSELINTGKYKLEKEWKCTKDDIINAVSAGFRAQVDVKGKLAELFLSYLLKQLKENRIIDDFRWNDKDSEPDFIVIIQGNEYNLECKNVRSGEKMLREDGYRLEVQKTRNSKDGSNTRSYRIDEFDLVAACLFNQVGKWDYLFAATKKLELKKGATNLLKTMQPIPFEPNDTWRPTLLEAIRDFDETR